MTNQNEIQSAPVVASKSGFPKLFITTFKDGSLIKTTNSKGETLQDPRVRVQSLQPVVFKYKNGSVGVDTKRINGFYTLKPGILQALEIAGVTLEANQDLNEVMNVVFGALGAAHEGFKMVVVEQITPFWEGQEPVPYPDGTPVLTKDGKPFYRETRIVSYLDNIQSVVLDTKPRETQGAPKETVDQDGKVIGDTSDEQG